MSASSKFPESGMAAFLDLSQWSKNVSQYIKDTVRMNAADAKSAKASELAARARDSYAQSMAKASEVAKKALDQQRQALRDLMNENKSFAGKSFDPSKWLPQKSGKTLADLVPKGVQDRLSQFTGGIGDLVGKMKFLPPGVQNAVSSLGNLGHMLGGTIGKLNLTTAAVVAVTAAFIGLGMRGAAMRGVIEAFDISADRAGVLSQTLLGDLRSASRGTIADMELMKTANVALAGATGQVAEALGKNGGLAGLMEIARSQARATGQDVGYLFNSLVSGVKRGTPLLIDNTGLVLKVSAANDAYAQSIGKVASQLSAEEKQIALLNATLDAGRIAVESYGSRSLTAAERLAQMSTTITNLMDRLALSVQPAFEFVLAIGNTLLNVIAYPIRDILIPIFHAFIDMIFGPLTRAWQGLTAGLNDLLAPALATVHRWVVLVVSIFRGFGTALNWLVTMAGKVLGPFKDVIKKYIVEPISTFLDPASFAQRAGNIFGAFATGILWAANTMIFPAVIAIAQFIADFLQGLSPPKKGPLSKIDKGGANVMQAWLDGFTGVSLTPVSQMAASVNRELGAIGGLNNYQANYLMARLDAQLQPFIDNLTIAKARMEAVVAPLKVAQEILQKRVTKNVKAFFGGDITAGEMRTLDAQNQAVADQLSMYEDMSAEAELQLSLAKAQQAVQRALLGIQIKRTDKSKDETATVTAGTTAGEKAAKEKKPKSGGTEDEATEDALAGGDAGGFGDFDSDPVGDFLGVTDEEVKQLWGDMLTGFEDGMTSFPGFDEQFGKAQENVGQLGEAFAGIKESKPFSFLSDAAKKIFGTEDGSIYKTISDFKTNHLEPIWDDMFGETGVVGKASTKFSDIVSDIEGFLLGADEGSLQSHLAGVVSGVTSWTLDFDAAVAAAIYDPFADIVSDIGSLILGGGGRAGPDVTLKSVLESVVNLPTTILGNLGTVLSDHLYQPFQSVVGKVYGKLFGGTVGDFSLNGVLNLIPGSIAGWLLGLGDKILTALYTPFEDIISDIGTLITGGEPGEGTDTVSLSSILTSIPGATEDALSNLFTVLWDNLYSPVLDIVDLVWTKLTGDEEGSLYNRLTSLPAKIGEWLKPLGDILVAAFAGPAVNAMNALLEIIEKGINKVIDQINGLAGYDIVEAGLKLLSIDKPQIDHVSIARIEVPSSAKGGFLGAGLAKVHGGEVLAAASKPYMVFPAKWVTAMEQIARNTSEQSYRPIHAPGSMPGLTTHERPGLTVNQHFNGRADEVSVKRSWYEMQALGVTG